MEGGNLSIVALEVREVEVIGESLLLPGEPATNTRATVMEFSVLNVHRGGDLGTSPARFMENTVEINSTTPRNTQFPRRVIFLIHDKNMYFKYY